MICVWKTILAFLFLLPLNKLTLNRKEGEEMKKELMLVMMGILLAFGGCIENREGGEVIPECERVEPGQVRAVKITSSHQLFGGRCSLGKIGDYKLQNANIAVITVPDLTRGNIILKNTLYLPAPSILADSS